MTTAAVADWYYIGHYGRLGPLTQEQVEDLADGGVITHETFVWKTGMPDWVTADRVPEIGVIVRQSAAFIPPPPPSPGLQTAYQPPPAAYAAPLSSRSMEVHRIRSSKSRVTAGILSIILPGVGRMYLGYLAHGVLQLVLTICTGGVLWLWSIVDGVMILSGSVKMDGYGRVLGD